MAPNLPGPPQRRSYQAWDAIAATPTDFELDAGVYGLTLHDTGWGSAQLSRLLTKGTILVPVTAAVVADGYQVLSLPAGLYRLTLTANTALTGAIEQIAPGRMGGG